MAATVASAVRESARKRNSFSQPFENTESFTDALIACVKALGGSKRTGPMLWPDLAPDAAQRKLLDCLNDDRPHQLNPNQVLLVLRRAREAGCHAGMEYLSAALSYAPPVPVEPQDEADELRRQVLDMGRTLQDALARLARIEGAR